MLAQARALPRVAISMGSSFFQPVVLRAKRQGRRQNPHHSLQEEGEGHDRDLDHVSAALLEARQPHCGR